MSGPGQDEDPRRPAPPVIPPAPPSPELLRAAPVHVPLTPMMDFLQRRLETLERELSAEKEKARSAQNLLSQQDTMRGEVETNLKALYEQIRREKSERETEEMKSHARGRIDVLEERLDEMHQTWSSLLKDAITNRDGVAKETGVAQAALQREIAAITEAVTALTAQLPELRSLVGQVPEAERKGFAQVADRLAGLAQGLETRLGDLDRRQSLQTEKLEGKVMDLARERAALQEAWLEQNHAIRQETVKDRILREGEVNDQVAELCKRLDHLASAQEKLTGSAGDVRSDVSKVLSLLNTPPRVKEQLIADLEREKSDLLKALKDRSDTLHKYMEDRKAVESTLGESLLALHARLDEENAVTTQAVRRAAVAEDHNASLTTQLEEKDRALLEMDRRWDSLASERDSLTRSLVLEVEKVRAQIDERTRSEAGWSDRLAAMQKTLEEKLTQNAQEGLAACELRSQVATLSEHLAKALKEKDAVSNRFASWEQDRLALISKLREKDAMIAMLSSSFQNMLKK